MRRRSGLLLVLSVCLLAGPTGEEMRTPRFPFMAWDYVDDVHVLEAMRDVGITSVAFVRPKMLDACQKFNISWTKPFDGEQFRRNLATGCERGREPSGLLVGTTSKTSRTRAISRSWRGPWPT